MNCKLSRLCNIINYLPIVGTLKSAIELIIAIADGESDEMVEMLIALIVSLVADAFSFGMLNAAAQGSFKCGQAFAISSQEVAKKIVEGMSGEGIKQLAKASFQEAVEGLIIVSAKEVTILGSEAIAKNATQIAARNLLFYEIGTSTLTKIVGTNTAKLLANENKIENFARDIGRCFMRYF
jgi:hypothetical protein